jgi:hypothetical protein
LPPAARADLAAAWSSATVASWAPQGLQVTIEELVAFAGAAKSWAPQAAQVRILGVFIDDSLLLWPRTYITNRNEFGDVLMADRLAYMFGNLGARTRMFAPFLFLEFMYCGMSAYLGAGFCRGYRGVLLFE